MTISRPLSFLVTLLAVATGVVGTTVATSVVQAPPAHASGAGGGELLYTAPGGGGFVVSSSETDGSDLRTVIDGAGNNTNPTVSPDGRRIAFVTNRDGNNEIYVADRNGENQVRVTNTPFHEQDPDWSAQNELVFTGVPSGTGEIYVANADGSGLTRLTNDSHADSTPTWAPDGNSIAFASSRSGNNDIWTMSATGANVVNLTTDAHNDAEPAWSPDGSSIVFSSDRSPADTRLHLYRMPATGGAALQLTSGNHDDRQPSWSPTGDRVAFTRSTLGTFDIQIVPSSGNQAVSPVTATAAAESAPDWAATCAAPFGDTPPWVAAAVDWSWCRAFLTGYPDNTFRANLSITRAQVVRLLYRVAGSPAVSALPQHGLSDVPAWVGDAVRWAKGNDIMTGYPDGTFRPNQPITRGQTIRAVFRAEGQPVGAPHPFSDVPGWLADAVNWAAHDPDGGGAAQPIMTGYPDGTFRDTLDITRAQTTRLVCRTNAAAGVC